MSIMNVDTKHMGGMIDSLGRIITGAARGASVMFSVCVALGLGAHAYAEKEDAQAEAPAASMEGGDSAAASTRDLHNALMDALMGSTAKAQSNDSVGENGAENEALAPLDAETRTPQEAGGELQTDFSEEGTWAAESGREGDLSEHSYLASNMTQRSAPLFPNTFGEGFPQKSPMTTLLMQIIGFLCLLAMGFYLALRVLKGRSSGGTLFRGSKGRHLDILETKVLGNKQFLVLVAHGRERILIGVSPAGITHLCALEKSPDLDGEEPI